ncbi:hypothetical protein C8R47DRAFT_1076598 [Mycena vitilis]|nr:hypothetical protein C8R47DRAFT_1076598 [Mycena vitilis]
MSYLALLITWLLLPQFLNRDTYGSPGSGSGPEDYDMQTPYQMLYHVAAEVRSHYLDGFNPDCSPVSVTSPQCTYLGLERDPEGREGHAYALLNADVTGHNTMLEEPYSLVGHAKLILYSPPATAGAPWPMEAPYASRAALKEVLLDFDAPLRPFHAFPDHSSSLRPPLDYLLPVPSFPPGFHPLPRTNEPRVDYCIPPLEADHLEVGRVINNSAIVHYAMQPPTLYDYIHRTPHDRIDDIDDTWAFLHRSPTGIRTWCRRQPVERDDLKPHPTHPRESVRLVTSWDGIPESPQESRFVANCLYKNARSNLVHSGRSLTVDRLANMAGVVQIPDPSDRFSRPVPRYTVPARTDEELERIRIITQEFAKEDSWKTQRAVPRQPPQYVLPRSLVSPREMSSPESLAPSRGSSVMSPPLTSSDDEYLEYYADCSCHELTEDEDSDEYSPPFSPRLPIFVPRPLEDGDSYFPPPTPALRPAAPADSPSILSSPMDSPPPPRQHRIANFILTERRSCPSLSRTRTFDSMPSLESVSTSSDDEDSDTFDASSRRNDSSPTEELVTAPSPLNGFWDGNSSTESVAGSSSDEDIPLFDQELLYPMSPTLPPRLFLRSPGLTTPPLQPFSLSPPLPDHDSLINLPGTTPLEQHSRAQAPKLMTRFARAALCSAETALRNISLAVTPERSPSVSGSMRDLELRIEGLERVAAAPLTIHPSRTQLSAGPRFPCDEDQVGSSDCSASLLLKYTQEARRHASDQLAALLAEPLRDPQVFRAEIDIPALDTELLLGFSVGLNNPKTLSPSLMTAPPAPIFHHHPSPVPYTPCVSPDLGPSAEPGFPVVQPQHSDTFFYEHLSVEERQFMEDLFDFSSDGATQDNDSVAASEWLEHNQAEWMAKYSDSEAIPWDEGLWSPPSRRPVRNECGIVTYDRRRYGWADFTKDAPHWSLPERRYHETLGCTTTSTFSGSDTPSDA